MHAWRPPRSPTETNSAGLRQSTGEATLRPLCCTVGTWTQKLPRLVKDNIKPWVLYGRTVLMKRTKVKPVHDFLFMDPHRGEPLDGRRFSELLMEAVEASCSFKKVGTQKLRRSLATGHTPHVCPHPPSAEASSLSLSRHDGERGTERGHQDP